MAASFVSQGQRQMMRSALDSKNLNRAGPAKADVVKEVTTCLQLGNHSALLPVPRRPHSQRGEAGYLNPGPLEPLGAFE